MVASPTLSTLSPLLRWHRLSSHWHYQWCWHHHPFCADIIALIVLVLLPLSCWHCTLVALALPLSVVPSTMLSACILTTQFKHNKGKEACMTRALMPVHQERQCQRDKGNDTSATGLTRQLDGGNNAGPTMVTMPMHYEGKEVNTIVTTTPAQQGQQHPCNVGDGANATRATMPLLQWQRPTMPL